MKYDDYKELESEANVKVKFCSLSNAICFLLINNFHSYRRFTFNAI